jgi:cytochrome c oxidase cbb3-type subunit 3
MKQRTPGFIFIPIVMIAIIAIVMMVTPIDFEMRSGFGGFISNTWNHFVETYSSGMAIGIVIVALIMLLIVNAVNKVIESQKFKKLTPEQQQQYVVMAKQNYFKKMIQSGRQRQTEEEEEAIILDHGFDGIKELDNALPQWWLAMFYMGCVFCVVYILAYSFTDFAHPYSEYEEDRAIAAIKDSIWIAQNDITIEEAKNKYTDEQALAEGKKTFETICATCHTKNAGGGIGPNLTDDYWINKTQDSLFYNIYNIVYNGSPRNPLMRPFGKRKELTGLAIEKVASYVYHMNRELPTVTPDEGGAKPQGDLIPEWEQPGEASTNAELTPVPAVKSDSLTTDSNQ